MAVAVLLTVCGGEETLQPEPEPPNNAPRAQGNLPDITLQVGETRPFGIGGTFVDPDGDALTYSAASSNTAVLGVSISGSTVTARGVSAGQASITVTARDPRGGSAQLSARATVEQGNRAPVLKSGHPSGHVLADTLKVGIPAFSRRFFELFEDPDDDPLTYSAMSSDTSILEVSTAGISNHSDPAQWPRYLPEAVGPGETRLTLTATDPGGLAAELHIDFKVWERNVRPERVGSIPDITLAVGHPVTITTDVTEYFDDPNAGDSLVYRVHSSSRNVEITLSGDTVRATGVARGRANVEITATDPYQGWNSHRFGITVISTADTCTPGSEEPLRWGYASLHTVLHVDGQHCYSIDVGRNPADRITVWTLDAEFDTQGRLYDLNYNLVDDDNDGASYNRTKNFQLLARRGYRYFVRVTGYGHLASGRYAIGVDDHANTFDAATDTWRSGNGYIFNLGRGTFSSDVFRFEVARAGTVTISTTGQINARGDLFNSNRARIQTTDTQPGDNFVFSQHLDVGTYFIRVWNEDHTIESRWGNYEIRIQLP